MVCFSVPLNEGLGELRVCEAHFCSCHIKRERLDLKMVVDMTRNELTIILLHGWGSESLVLGYFSLAKNRV